MADLTSDPVDAYRDALVDAVRLLADGAQVEHRWPGPMTESEGIYLGNETAAQDDPALVAGKRWRWANVDLQVVCQTFRTGITPADALLSYQRVKQLKDALDQAIAADPKMAGTTGPAGRSKVSGWVTEYVEFESGWADRLTAVVAIEFRLT